MSSLVVSALKLRKIKVGKSNTLEEQQPLLIHIKGSSLQNDTVNDTIDKYTDNEPVSPRKIAPDHTKNNTLGKLNSETVQFLIFSKEIQELVTVRFGFQKYSK